MENKKENELTVRDLSKSQTRLSMLIIGMLFFVFGFVSWVNAILIPYFKVACELSHFQSYLVAFAFYISYLVISVPAAFLLKRYGFKNGIMIGFWMMALGAFIFIPAAFVREYLVFLIGLFGIGAGLAVLQTAANPYITLLGPKETAAQRISLMGICNKGAGILAPLILASLLLREGDDQLFAQLPALNEASRAAVLDQLILRVVWPYAVVGIVLLLLGLIVKFSPLPEINTDNAEPEEKSETAGLLKTNIFQFPHLILGALALFLHVGTQVIAIDTIINYAGDIGMPLSEAKVFPSYTLTATIIGYLLGIFLIPKIISQLSALRICTVLGLFFALGILLAPGEISFLGHQTAVSIWFVVFLGLANSLIWAGIWPLALEGLGRFTKLGASVLIMGLCGNALLPLGYGYLADIWNLRWAYSILLPCYVYLMFYAFYAYRWRKWSSLNGTK